jgi:hypothetical protein
MTTWLPGAHVVDLSGSRGNGPFSDFLGVCLHVNVDENGTSDSYFESNPGEVTPNFQVYKSAAAGGIHQFLPFNWQPWCQIDGNFNYAAIETAGMPGEALTDYQMHAIASILAVYHAEHGMALHVTDNPGSSGFITHQAGGEAWGGHSCPGPIRAAQRQAIIDLIGTPPTPGDDMSQADIDAINKHTDARMDALSAGLVRRLDTEIWPAIERLEAAAGTTPKAKAVDGEAPQS